MFYMAWSPSRRAFPSHYPSPFASVLYFMGTDLKLETLAIYLNIYTYIYTGVYFVHSLPKPTTTAHRVGSSEEKKKSIGNMIELSLEVFFPSSRCCCSNSLHNLPHASCFIRWIIFVFE